MYPEADWTAVAEREANRLVAEADLGLQGVVDTDLDPGECATTWDELAEREAARLGLA